jgi:hypothetical protein
MKKRVKNPKAIEDLKKKDKPDKSGTSFCRREL